MAESVQSRPAVLDLQERAQTTQLGARTGSRPRRQRASRAARLQLIDILSRWAGSGLALLAGVAIFTAISVGRYYPFRAAVWASLVLAALYVARRMLRNFRSGRKSTARPFRWRANYTAALAVVSAAFGAGALILLPAGAHSALAYQTLALLFTAALGAGVIHAAHGRTALAAWLPAFAFSLLGALKIGGASLALLGAAPAFATGAAALFFFHSYLRHKITRRFPRTSIVRRGITPDAGELFDIGERASTAVGTR